MDQLGINFENGAQGMAWLEGFERVPLKQRLKLLLASHRGSDVKFDSQGHVLLPNAGPETEAGHFDAEDSQFHCFSEEPMNGSITILMEERNAAVAVLGNAGELEACQGSLTHQYTSSSHDIADSSDGSLLAKHPVTVKIECAENIGEGTSSNHLTGGSSLVLIKSVTVEPEMSKVYLDKLDHVALKERLRRLLTSNSLGLKSEMLQRNTPAAAKEDLACGNQRNAMPDNKMHETAQALMSSVSEGTMDSSCKPHQKLDGCSRGNKSSSAVSSGIKSSDNIYSEEECSRYEYDGGKALPSRDSKTGQGSAMPTVAKIKVEHPTYDEFQTSFVPMDDQMSLINLVQVKSELQNAAYEYEDELDHMLLRERMKLLSSRDGPTLDINQSSKCTNKLGSAFVFTSVASSPAQSLKYKRARKRRKTATDSVETAMEEDAPGLLQVLMEKGVSVDEIKLYGEPESNDALDESSTDNDFVELEEIISKVFSKQEALLKFARLRCNRGEKATYCLECLFSLVEQARYLQFRNWPVEWGWCRDLQSFIFVFERHNRIVLERPEYGYATYFFELAESSSIGWQIKRLVTAMKLTTCSRATLIENKALMEGDDLTEGEAQVLMKYGWVQNTGLGTMLNYYDRVVHDRKNEDRSEWRSKIGKLLMDGYNGGKIVSMGISPKVECDLEQPSEDIKLELT